MNQVENKTIKEEEGIFNASIKYKTIDGSTNGLLSGLGKQPGRTTCRYFSR